MDIFHGNCLDHMLFMEDNSVDAIVTDPPYGLSFMGKKWDYDVPGVDIWTECLRVLKPGGHLLAFAGTRTQEAFWVRVTFSTGRDELTTVGERTWTSSASRWVPFTAPAISAD